MPDDEPFDLLDAAIRGIADVYSAEARRMMALRDDEPAPLYPPVEQP